MKCRFCGMLVSKIFVDLIAAPLSNSFLQETVLNEPETYYPLKVYVCDECFLVQIDEYKKSTEIFSAEYAYFSSTSKMWLDHARQYVDMIVPRCSLSPSSLVVEIASNDGYLLQYFMEKKIPCLGIEPAGGTAQVAREKGISVVEKFFGTALALELKGEGIRANLVVGNNVLAHVPDINDFVGGLGIILRTGGTITMEFPHLMRLVENNQFDTIYHEHFSYLSLGIVRKIFLAHGLRIYDVEEIATHGGSLRIYACHADFNGLPVSARVGSMLARETTEGMFSLAYYLDFKSRAFEIKLDFLEFLVTARRNRKKVAAYGAAAKGNTLLNFCGVKNDLIDFVVDAAPSKQGRYLPGSHIPVVTEAYLRKERPDYVIVFPWNIKEEITEQLRYIRQWDGRFVIAVPRLTII